MLRRGRHAGGRLVSLHALGADGEGVALAVVASRRVGGAVDRNRAKRLMREAARRLPWRPSQDLVVVAREDCARVGRRAVQDELRRLAGELGALADSQRAHV